MAEVTTDRGTAVFIGMELEKIRAAVKEDIKRYDIYPADRRELHILEDALNVVIRRVGAQRPNKQGKEIGYPSNIILADWGDSIDVWEVSDENLDDELASLEDTIDVQIFRGLKVTDEPVVTYMTPELAPEDVAEERKREVVNRKREIESGEYRRKHGNAPNFKVGL